MLNPSSRRRRTIAMTVALVAALTAACGDDDDDAGDEGGSGGVTVTASNFAFDPSELTAAAGETITLRNQDDVEHSFTIDDPEVDAEAEGGEEANATAPDSAGTYDFYCRYHPDQMTGTLTVR
jgi:plastocyanin